MRQIHIANAGGRDATVTFATPKVPPAPKLGLPGAQVEFRRYIVATPETMHAHLERTLGEAYGDQLVAADPEVDFERVGRRFAPSARVFLTSKGEVMHAVPNMVEVIVDPDGTERERRAPKDQHANINAELPVRWTGKTMRKRDAVRRFAFTRTVALSHVDGLSFDFLQAMAKELAASGDVVLLGGGAKGKDPLILQENGSPYRAFLEGRVDGDKFALLLHLSHLELKRPAPKES
ncbi:MAG: hypothetical protein ACE37F_35600 [Nannocystaceae bacterium]|nr:hypothetical protein [bacterium]